MKNMQVSAREPAHEQKKQENRERTFCKNFFRTLGAFTIASILSADVASASAMFGKVTFVGTTTEDNSGGVYSARLRVRVNGTCDSDSAVQDRWVIIKSGRMDGIFAHNGVNMKNAYSTLLSAFNSGKNVQIDGLPNCSTTQSIPLDLWVGEVGTF